MTVEALCRISPEGLRQTTRNINQIGRSLGLDSKETARSYESQAIQFVSFCLFFKS